MKRRIHALCPVGAFVASSFSLRLAQHVGKTQSCRLEMVPVRGEPVGGEQLFGPILGDREPLQLEPDQLGTDLRGALLHLGNEGAVRRIGDMGGESQRRLVGGPGAQRRAARPACRAMPRAARRGRRLTLPFASASCCAAVAAAPSINSRAPSAPLPSTRVPMSHPSSSAPVGGAEVPVPAIARSGGVNGPAHPGGCGTSVSSMARSADRHHAGAPGDWFVDDRCIDCDAARHVAPGLIARNPGDGNSYFVRQPESSEEIEMAWRAVQVCPTRSVGHVTSRKPERPAFPQDLGDGVYRLGHNARSSFGAHSYVVARSTGNVMIDAPRWTREVVEPLTGLGGVSHVLLSHRDDIADADRYAEHFGARVWIHEDDATAAPYATDHITGTDVSTVAGDIVAHPVPGPHERQRPLPRRRPSPLLRRLARMEPAAGAVDGLPQCLLVLVGGPDRLARPIRRARRVVRPSVLRPRVEPRRRGREVRRRAPRPRRPHALDVSRVPTGLVSAGGANAQVSGRGWDVVAARWCVGERRVDALGVTVARYHPDHRLPRASPPVTCRAWAGPLPSSSCRRIRHA